MKYDKYENYQAKLSSQTLKHTVCLTLFTLAREKRSKQLDVFQEQRENTFFKKSFQLKIGHSHQ